MAFTPKTVSLAQAAVTAVGRIVDTAVRALTAAWVKAWDAVAAAFTAALTGLLAGAETWPTRRAIETDPDLQGALNDAERALDALADLTRSETLSAARKGVGRAARDQLEIIGSQLPPGHEPVADRPGGFHQRAVDTIIARTGQRITSLTRPLSRDADMAMRRALIRGVRVGDNPRETAARMVRQVEGAFNRGLTRAATIARTETLDAYRRAAAATEQDTRHVLSGWVWLAKLDDGRTCPACWALHGTEHPLTEPGPLGHPNCRCSRAPKTMSWRELGFELDEPEGQIPDAEAAFADLSRAEQVRVMGAARVRLLDRGSIKWGDLARRRENPGWRDSFEVTPLSALTRTLT